MIQTKALLLIILITLGAFTVSCDREKSKSSNKVGSTSSAKVDRFKPTQENAEKYQRLDKEFKKRTTKVDRFKPTQENVEKYQRLDKEFYERDAKKRTTRKREWCAELATSTPGMNEELLFHLCMNHYENFRRNFQIPPK